MSKCKHVGAAAIWASVFDHRNGGKAGHHEGPCRLKECQRCRSERAEAELAASREECERLREALHSFQMAKYTD